VPWGGHEDRLAPKNVRAEHPWLLERDKPMVLSPDLDGLLSGALLSQALGWRLVGLYDASTLWLRPGFKPSDAVFVDHDIYDRRIASIGHHILVWGPDVRALPRKHTDPGVPRLNPNLARRFCFRDHFARKYPFGTFHLLLVLYANWDKISVPQPTEDFLALALHVDSSLQNAFSYPENALDWMRWLGGDEKQSPLYSVCRAIATIPARRLLETGLLAKAKIRLRGFSNTKQGHQCTIDPTSPDEWARWIDIARWVGAVLDCAGWASALQAFSPTSLQPRSIHRAHCTPNKRNFVTQVLQGSPFSYAIESQMKNRGLNYGHLA